MTETETLTQSSTPVSGMQIPTPPPVDEIKEQIDQLLRMAKLGLYALALNIIVFVVAAFFRPMATAKCILIELMIVGGVICFALAFLSSWLHNQLLQAEEIAVFGRDTAFIELNSVRHQLQAMRKKITQEEELLQHGVMPELLKTVGPLMMFVMQKEKSMVRWGMLGMKIAKNAMALMRERANR